MKNISSEDPQFEVAVKLASRSNNDLEFLRDPSFHPPKKSREVGAGRKVKAPAQTSFWCLYCELEQISHIVLVFLLLTLNK